MVHSGCAYHRNGGAVVLEREAALGNDRLIRDLPDVWR
jgi:hypothetical protein